MSTESNLICLSKDSDAEVELISLTIEKLPRYRLRADCNIQFSGYQHSDFKRAEQVKEVVSELTNEQIEKTLEYFLLCGLRVNKMTETFEDCAALRLLVEEQRAHMDEAANIGLNLLQKNIQLEQRLTTLEDQLVSSKETIGQLRHQLHLKDDLLRLLHNEIEEAEDVGTCNSECTIIDRLGEWIVRSRTDNNIDKFFIGADECGDHRDILTSGESTFSLEKINLKHLESKLCKLEEENYALRNQQSNLSSHTDFLESKEQQLIDDCVRQLLDSTKTVERLSSELNKKTNDYLNQHEEISRLLTTNIDLENKIHQLLSDNDHLFTQLHDQQTKQFTLTKELTDLRDRYDECINLLNERQDQIRQLKKKYKRETMKQIQGYRPSSPDINLPPSLAMEFEDSNRKESIIADHSRAMRVMEQARTINSSLVDTDETSSGFTDDLTSSMINIEQETSVQNSSGGNYLLRRSIQEDCEKRRMFRTNPSDMDSSLIDSHMDNVTSNTVASFYASEAFRHRQNRCQTIRSLNTNILNSESHSMLPHSFYKTPDKLQLVKPIEGSQTLRNWQNLATPSITKALFEQQSHSVCFRGQQPLMSPSPSSPNSEHSISTEMNTSLHSSMISSDYEDIDCDEPITLVESKSPDSPTTYTNTNSKVMYPTNGQHSGNGFMNNKCNSRRDVTSTFSLNLDVANPVNERGITHNNVDYLDNTPVNEMKLDGIGGARYSSPPRFSQAKFANVDSPSQDHQRSIPSWLDRLTVKSIMTSILGYPLPHLHRALTNATHTSADNITATITTSTYNRPIVSSSVSSSNHSSSIIGRLTNLPPLAQRRFPQSGLNLLASGATFGGGGGGGGCSGVSHSRSGVVHRIEDLGDMSESEEVPGDLSSPVSGSSQID